MEGPTPVSALIHAATMVTAGVYLIVRSSAIFNLHRDRAHRGGHRRRDHAASSVRSSVAAKDDIKKALAGSTMSQIGYMILAAGLGPVGYAFAIFHLLTHGFFKADLFLGAGSVMHGMNDQVEHAPVRRAAQGHDDHLRHLRGSATSPSSACRRSTGFYSKDKIIEAAFAGEPGWSLGWVALLGAGITAFYMTRLLR